MEIDRSFRLGAGHDFVSVRVRGLRTDDVTTWVPSDVEIVAGAFSGSFSADFEKEDFVSFRHALHELYAFREGEASFHTVEGQLAIEIRGDYKGHFEALVTAMDASGIGNKLAAMLHFDQTELVPTMRDLDAICAALTRA